MKHVRGRRLLLYQFVNVMKKNGKTYVMDKKVLKRVFIVSKQLATFTKSRPILSVVIVLVSIIPSILVFGFSLNSYLLWRFSSQLNQVDDVFPYHFSYYVAASGSRIYTGGGNDDYCNYSAIRVYGIKLNNHELNDVLARIHQIRFDPVNDIGMGRGVIVTVFERSRLLIVEIRDEGRPAGLDLRCY